MNEKIRDEVKRKIAVGDFEDVLLGNEGYRLAVEAAFSDIYLPTNSQEIIELIIEEIEESNQVIEKFNGFILKLITSNNDYFFLIGVDYIFTFYVIKSCREIDDILNISLVQTAFKEFTLRRERIREKGVINYDGKQRYPLGDIQRMIRFITDSVGFLDIFTGQEDWLKPDSINVSVVKLGNKNKK